MPKKISIDPDWLLEWLIDCGYVEKTESAFSPYRIATNSDTDRPYTITVIVHHLQKSLNRPGRADHNKALCREVQKCFSEYNISYMSLVDHALLCTEMKQTRIKEIAEIVGIDIDLLSSHERRNFSVLCSRYTKLFEREEALKRISAYAQRRFQNPVGDLRKGKARRFNNSKMVKNVQSQPDTESLESLLRTSGTLFSKLPVSVIHIDRE